MCLDSGGKNMPRQKGNERKMKMKKRYVILDPKGWFFRDFTDAIPQVVNAFTDCETWAWKMDGIEEAKKIKAKLLDRLYSFDGQQKVPQAYLRIAEIEYRIVG
jgi:hypothetical protein